MNEFECGAEAEREAILELVRTERTKPNGFAGTRAGIATFTTDPWTVLDRLMTEIGLRGAKNSYD